MKPLLMATFLLLAAAACSRHGDFVAVDPGDEAIVFTDDQTMANDIQIVIRRTPSGDYVADSFELSFEKGLFGRLTRRARPLASHPISRSAYDEMAAQLDSGALRNLSHHYPPAGLDGWTWRIRHISSRGNTEFAFHCPEWARKEPDKSLRDLDTLLDLGRRITQSAGVSDLDAFQRLKGETP